MKKVFFILLVLSNLFSCKQPKENNSESKIEDPIILHREHIVNNLTPFYYLKNKIQPKRVEEVMQEYKVPGLRIVFVDKGKISWSKNYGYANLKDSIKIDDSEGLLDITIFSKEDIVQNLTVLQEAQFSHLHNIFYL